MSLEKTISTKIADNVYLAKEFVWIPHLTEGDKIDITVTKDGKAFTESWTVETGEEIAKHRIRFIKQIAGTYIPESP